MRVAGLQLDIVWEDRVANFARHRPWIQAAAAAGAELVILPEMFACGFTMDANKVAESTEGPSTAFLIEQARTCQTWIGGSLPERVPDHPRPYNCFVLAGPNGELFRYRKIHPFTFAGEHEAYAAGDTFVTVSIHGVRCTLFVCYDLRFADEFWATAAATDCYVVVANWPERRRDHWRTLLRARAIENQAYVVGVNRVGRGNELDYAGDSCIIDPWGEALASAQRRPTLVLADIDANVVADARSKFPVFRDRR